MSEQLLPEPDPGYIQFFEDGQSTSADQTQIAAHLRRLRNDFREIEPTPAEDPGIVRRIHEWYHVLGAENRLEGAEDDLLYASAVVYERNHVNPTDEFSYLKEPVADTYTAVEALFSQNEMTKQRPSRELVLIGDMLFDAARLERDAARRERLRSFALAAYERVLDPHAHPNERNKNSALHGKFNVLSEEAHETAEHNQRQGQLLYARAHKFLLDEFRKSLVSGVDKGVVWETFGVLAMSHNIWRQGLVGKVNTRFALSREDEPHDIRTFQTSKVRSQTAFDAQVSATTGEKVKLQFKSSRHGAERQYAPDIRVVVNPGFTNEDYFKFSEIMLDEMNGEQVAHARSQELVHATQEIMRQAS